MAAAESALRWSRVGQLVADRIGLHFPEDRHPELLRGLHAFAAERGFADVGACVEQLLGGEPAELDLAELASHLTVGETYFLRGHRAFAALAEHVLPALAAARRRDAMRLKIWSAGCCTGEEAYSLAIVLREVLPDIDDWQVDILATDINPRFLEKAAAGVYGEWSFRGVPAGFRRRYFEVMPDGRSRVIPEIRRMVRFVRMNLAEPGLATRAGGPGTFDLILCRNVLMYFSAEQSDRVAGELHRALREDGWLVVAPCEISPAPRQRFSVVSFDDTIFYSRESAAVGRRAVRSKSSPQLPKPIPQAPGSTLQARAFPPTSPGERATVETPAWQPTPGAAFVPSATTRKAPVTPPESSPPSPAETSRDRPLPDAAAFAALAVELADQGRLAEARQQCERWIAHDKLDARAHYLHAVVLVEAGDSAGARAALSRSLYLEPTPAASYALASLERSLGRPSLARQHLSSTLELLATRAADEPLAYADGIRCGQLQALVRDALAREGGDD